MSGNAWKDYETERVTKKDYFGIIEKIKPMFGSGAIAPLGSCQYFTGDHPGDFVPDDVGDVDIAIELEKKQIIDIVSSNKCFLAHKVFGNTVSTLFTDGKNNYHVDLMPSKCSKNEAWVMSANMGDPRIKGNVRNIMLSYLAKKHSAEISSSDQDIKITVAFPGGIRKKLNGVDIPLRSNHPAAILSSVGLPYRKGFVRLCRSFEGIIDLMGDNMTNDFVSGFKEYATKSWNYKKDPVPFNLAFQYMDERVK